MQDISHYDTKLTSGQVLSGINEDCAAVQNAISQKVGNAIHNLTTVVAALTLAIIRGWKLALVMIALMPLIAVAGGILAKVFTSGTTQRAEAYAKANTMSSQAISNVRTVQSFQAEESMLSRYTDLLEYPRKISVRLSAYSGMAQGFINLVIFVTYVLPFCYDLRTRT
jgi:ATP-binding cassette, subfamily B (MDR/TAP), member 1